MKNFFEYFLLYFFYYLFKILGLRVSSFIGGVTFYFYGIFSKRNKTVKKNLYRVFPNLAESETARIIKNMWFHFGRVIGEYPNLGKIKITKFLQ